MYERGREFQTGLFAAIRADLHNTSSRQYEKFYEPGDFMPGVAADLEARVEELIAQGIPPATAAAMATSKQTKEQKIHLINGLQHGKKRTANGSKRPARSAEPKPRGA